VGDIATPSSTVLDVVDATEPIDRLLRDLRASRNGLSTREADRRLIVYGPNALQRRGRRRWWRDLARQFTHPLALLLWAASGFAWLAGIVAVAIAIVVVIVVNAIFAFVQEMHAERAVEALQGYLPSHATVLRDGVRAPVEVAQLVPGDVLDITEGDRISADARLLSGTIEVDTSTLTGESSPMTRSADWTEPRVPLLEAPDLVFSGTACTGGGAQALVYATGMHTELGRISALSERVETEESPLEHQVRRVAWLIAVVAVLMALAFLPLATLGAGLSLSQAALFAVGLIAGLVPEGLLPVITLSLATGVRGLVRRGAIVKRLSAVETLGSTDVICTDKTGTLTENRMQVAQLWTSGGQWEPGTGPDGHEAGSFLHLARVAVACNNARSRVAGDGVDEGEPTEVALLEAGTQLGPSLGPEARDRARRVQFPFDPVRKLMSTVDELGGARWVDAKGAPEAVVERCAAIMTGDGDVRSLSPGDRAAVARRVDEYAGGGLRVLALATRALDPAAPLPSRDDAERDLTFVGLAALVDPPRPGVAEAVARCHTAGIRVHVVTGDHPLTALAIAQRVGISADDPTVITGGELDRLTESELEDRLQEGRELVFARSSPEAKLRIADALRAEGHIVAMTGDGVNDAPALRRADIGVAMGRSGTDVAREASTMVLTDDNFATIVTAVEAGRRVYDNVRKFIFYIFAHATPETVPFLVFALARGAIPLPLTVLQLLAFDVGTETLPALALGQEPAEPGLMQRPPRPRREGVIRRPMLIRAWLFVGLIAAALQMAAFFFVLLHAGWQPNDPVGAGTPLHHAYLQATTMTFLAMVMGQVGTAFAARTEHASLRSVGVFSNRLLLWGVAFELAITALVIYFPPLQHLLGTAALPAHLVLLTVPFPFIVWGSDELRRYAVRRHHQA